MRNTTPAIFLIATLFLTDSVVILMAVYFITGAIIPFYFIDLHLRKAGNRMRQLILNLNHTVLI